MTTPTANSTETPIRLALAGATGRMGQAILRVLQEGAAPGLTVSGAFDRPEADASALAAFPNVPLADEAASGMAEAQVLIDFTLPAPTLAHARLAADKGLALVIGTTGFDPAQEAELENLAKRIPLVKAGNMSLGVNLMAALVKRVAQTLEIDWDIEILEMHHRHKVDAPSGTALLFGEAAAAGRQVSLEAAAVKSREGHTGERAPGAIGFATLRGGSVVGDHSVLFAGEKERLTLSHQAEDRAIFARGALKAAQWVVGKPPGLYGMADVLGLADL